MRLRTKRNKGLVEVSTASLNDIMFFLLLFFLIASTISNPNVIKLLLPKSDTGQVISKRNVNLAIDAKKNLFIDQEPIKIGDLMSRLKSITSEEKQEVTVILYADKTVPIEEVVRVMDIANRFKIKIVLATLPQK